MSRTRSPGSASPASDLADRDLLVATLVRERGIPMAMVLSGGYARESWRVHADGIEAILTRFDRVRDEPGRRRGPSPLEDRPTP